MADALTIEAICKELVKKDEYLNACNSFVRGVAERLWPKGTVPGALGGTANTIMAALASNASFTNLKSDDDSATKYARDGFFVIGGLAKTDGSGHVFVVVPGGPSPKGAITPWKDTKGVPYKSRGGYPYAYNGSSAPALRIRERISVDLMFSAKDMQKVTYFAIPDPRNKQAAFRGASSATMASVARNRNGIA